MNLCVMMGQCSAHISSKEEANFTHAAARSVLALRDSGLACPGRAVYMQRDLINAPVHTVKWRFSA